MKISLAVVTAVAAATLSTVAVAKSSSNIPQSALDPLAIQEETEKETAQRRSSDLHQHRHKSFLSHAKAAKPSKTQEALTNDFAKESSTTRRSSLSWSDTPRGSTLGDFSHSIDNSSLNNNSKRNKKNSYRSQNKQVSQQPNYRYNSAANKSNQSALADNGGGLKNMFHNGASAAANVVTAPARKLWDVFSPQKSQP
jgi:hypothetical protein